MLWQLFTWAVRMFIHHPPSGDFTPHPNNYSLEKFPGELTFVFLPFSGRKWAPCHLVSLTVGIPSKAMHGCFIWAKGSESPVWWQSTQAQVPLWCNCTHCGKWDFLPVSVARMAAIQPFFWRAAACQNERGGLAGLQILGNPKKIWEGGHRSK